MEKIDWTKITYEDVLKAIEIFNRENPEYPEPKVTFLIHNKQKLPAKHIRGMAYKVAYGKEIKKSDFGGGMETVKFFERLGFEVDYRGKSIRERKDNVVERQEINKEENKVEANKIENNHLEENSIGKIKIPGKGVIEQKNALQLLLNKIYKGDIVCEKTFPWLKSPKEMKGSYIDIFEGLKSYRGDSTFAKRNVTLRCDFVCESEKTIIEYDERQHFTEARRRALLSYKDIKLDYDRELWIKACKDIQAKDNHPFNRDEARAYYDSIRDIEAGKNGYKLIRIMHGQTDFESDDSESALKKILGLDDASKTKDIKIIDGEENSSVTLNPDVLEDFKDKLIDTNILNWKRRYDDNEILDGTQWEIILVRDGRNIIRSGSNDYPKEWEQFCNQISKISGRIFE